MSLDLSTLKGIEGRVANSERGGLEARWNFGHELLKLRGERKQLPKGVIAQVSAELKVHRSELNARMKFAEKYPTEARRSDAIREFGSWSRIIRRALTDNPRPGTKRGDTSLVGRVLNLLEQLDYVTLDREDQERLREVRAAVDRALNAVESQKEAA